MKTKNWKPKTPHKQFHDRLFKLGCIVTGSWPQLHHVVGASHRQGGVWIGQWYLLPLSLDLHMDGNVNVTNNKIEFYEKVGSEKKFFWWLLVDYLEEYKEFPLTVKELIAIYECNEGNLLCSPRELEEQEESFIELLRTLKIYAFEEIANEADTATNKSKRNRHH